MGERFSCLMAAPGVMSAAMGGAATTVHTMIGRAALIVWGATYSPVSLPAITNSWREIYAVQHLPIVQKHKG